MLDSALVLAAQPILTSLAPLSRHSSNTASSVEPVMSTVTSLVPATEKPM